CLAVLEPAAAEVVAVKVQQIEGIVVQLAGGARGRQSILQRAEVAHALLVDRHHLAVGTASLTLRRASSPAMALKRRVQSCALRLIRRTQPPSTWARMR